MSRKGKSSYLVDDYTWVSVSSSSTHLHIRSIERFMSIMCINMPSFAKIVNELDPRFKTLWRHVSRSSEKNWSGIFKVRMT